MAVSEGHQLADLAPAGFHQGLTRNVAGWRRYLRPSLALGLDDGDELVDCRVALAACLDDGIPGVVAGRLSVEVTP